MLSITWEFTYWNWNIETKKVLVENSRLCSENFALSTFIILYDVSQ